MPVVSEEQKRTVERFRLALELYEVGEAVMRQNLRRANPTLSEAEIERRLVAWLQERPGAEGGDAVGRVSPWPRRAP